MCELVEMKMGDLVDSILIWVLKDIFQAEAAIFIFILLRFKTKTTVKTILGNNHQILSKNTFITCDARVLM